MAKVARISGRTLLYALLTLGTFATLAPFLWSLSASFKSAAEIARIPPTLLPQNPTLNSYRTILHDPRLPLERFYFNSLFVAVSVTALVLFSSSLAGYIFAKYRFAGKEMIFGLLLSTMMIPGAVTVIPSYLILVKLHLLDTLWGLIIPSAVDAFGIYLMRQFIETIPSELIDAARVDGCSEFGIYWRIILPQIGPAIATLGVFTFMWVWNDYLWPLIVITTTERRTLPIVLTWFSTQHSTRNDLVMAASIMVVLPVIIAYFIFQRWFVEGMVLTGFK